MQKVKQYKVSRRLGVPIYEKCQTQKFVVREGRRGSGKVRKSRGGPMSLSEYGKQLIEKQKAQYLYGIREGQLKKYVVLALSKSGDRKDNFINALESRLDNVVYRSGLSSTRRAARQLVSHGHILVNDRKIKTASFLVKSGDVISIREGSKKITPFLNISKSISKKGTTKWIKVDPSKMTFTISGKPSSDTNIFDVTRIFEYYSR